LQVVILTGKEEGVGIPHATDAHFTEDYRIPNHSVRIGSHSFIAAFDSGAGVSSVSSKIADEIGLKKYPHTGTNADEGYQVPVTIWPYNTQLRVDILNLPVCIISVTDLLKQWTVKMHEHSSEFIPPQSW